MVYNLLPLLPTAALDLTGLDYGIPKGIHGREYFANTDKWCEHAKVTGKCRVSARGG